jgi:aromatic ring-cleaving dioxygenase
MDFQLSEHKKDAYAFTFEDWETELIVKGFEARIKQLEIKIQKIAMNPKNDGQVEFIDAARECRLEIKELYYNIQQLKTKRHGS